MVDAKTSEIHGVSENSNENIPDIVVKVAEKLGINIKQEDIMAAHRIH